MNIVYKVHGCTISDRNPGSDRRIWEKQDSQMQQKEKEQKGCVYRLLRRSTLGWMC